LFADAVPARFARLGTVLCRHYAAAAAAAASAEHCIVAACAEAAAWNAMADMLPN